MEKDKVKSHEFVLEATSELRIETAAKCTIQLKAGLAEIFGTELSKNKEYTFTAGGKFAVFTWHGCTILMTGNIEDAYISKETPMIFYVNIHTALDQMRTRAENDIESRGPRVMVVGPDDVGKTTLCKMLLNWAVRVGRSPIFVDLDVNQNLISLPGTISALIVERTAHVEEGYNLDAQIAYHYGYKTPQENPVLYKKLISVLTETINIRSDQIRTTLVSGVIINTSGWIRDEGYKSLVHIATEFDVNLVLVIDQERLCIDLARDLPDRVKVLSLPKSGGVVPKSHDLRINQKNQRIREYFYGAKSNLYPYSFDVKFNELKIYKVGAPQLPDSMLPMGMNRDDNYTKVFKITPSLGLVNHLLSVVQVTDIDDETEKTLIESNIAGYLVVIKVDMEKQSMTIMSTHPKPLPKTIILVSDIQFVDLK